MAGVAGLTEAEVRDALAAKAASPVRLDSDYEGSQDWAERLSDPAADIESQAALGAASRAARGLTAEQQVMLMSRYFRGQPLEAIAGALGIERGRAQLLARGRGARRARRHARRSVRVAPERTRDGHGPCLAWPWSFSSGGLASAPKMTLAGAIMEGD
jgi:DNA-directed RNA polymerase specialized sigma24 family protein